MNIWQTAAQVALILLPLAVAAALVRTLKRSTLALFLLAALLLAILLAAGRADAIPGWSTHGSFLDLAYAFIGPGYLPFMLLQAGMSVVLAGAAGGFFSRILEGIKRPLPSTAVSGILAILAGVGSSTGAVQLLGTAHRGRGAAAIPATVGLCCAASMVFAGSGYWTGVRAGLKDAPAALEIVTLFWGPHLFGPAAFVVAVFIILFMASSQARQLAERTYDLRSRLIPLRPPIPLLHALPWLLLLGPLVGLAAAPDEVKAMPMAMSLVLAASAAAIVGVHLQLDLLPSRQSPYRSQGEAAFSRASLAALDAGRVRWAAFHAEGGRSAPGPSPSGEVEAVAFPRPKGGFLSGSLNRMKGARLLMSLRAQQDIWISAFIQAVETLVLILMARCFGSVLQGLYSAMGIDFGKLIFSSSTPGLVATLFVLTLLLGSVIGTSFGTFEIIKTAFWPAIASVMAANPAHGAAIIGLIVVCACTANSFSSQADNVNLGAGYVGVEVEAASRAAVGVVLPGACAAFVVVMAFVHLPSAIGAALLLGLVGIVLARFGRRKEAA